MNAKQIDDTIAMLSHSQGFYGRLRRDLGEATPEAREEFYSRFRDCKDPVDFVMAPEG